MRTWFAMLCLVVALAGAVPAGDGDIYLMLVGERVLELQETTRLTSLKDGKVEGAWISPDGKFVAYVTDMAGKDGHTRRLCVTRSSGGNVTVLLSQFIKKDEDAAAEVWTPDISDWSQISWSPDSRLIAVPAVRKVIAEKDQTWPSVDRGIIVLTTGGLSRGAFSLPTDTNLMSSIIWNPGSTKFAFKTDGMTSGPVEQAKSVGKIMVCDILRGTCDQVKSQELGAAYPHSWSADGKSVRYNNTYISSDKAGGKRQQVWQFREMRADGSSDALIEEMPSPWFMSPDRRMRLISNPGLSIEDRETGSVTQVFKQFDGELRGWTPDSRMIVYYKSDVIKDQSGKRAERLRTCWLAVPGDEKWNHMCVALDVDADSGLSFSHDGMKMAYRSRGRITLAEMGWADMSTAEKADAGMPLTEEEEKGLLAKNAKQIGAGLSMYAADWDGGLPSADEFVQQLDPYAKNSNLFNRPGTTQLAFQYFPLGDMKNISNPAETVIGKFDVGYSWQVILYADGHVKVEPKQ